MKPTIRDEEDYLKEKNKKKDYYDLAYSDEGRFREDEFYRWKEEVMAKKKKKTKKKKSKSKKKKKK